MSNATSAPERARIAKVFCADDNQLVTDALRLQIERAPDFRWMGCAPDAGEMVAAIATAGCPDIVLLDIDMPGMDPFEAIAEVLDLCANARILMYSGIVRRDFIDRAIEAGAWGYIAKADGEEALLTAMRQALAGEIALSPEVESVYRL